MRTCPKCRRPNEAHATFCAQCGHLISETFFGMLDRCVRDWDKGDHWDFTSVREWIRAQPGDRVVARCDALGSMVLLHKRVALEILEDWDRHGRLGKTVDQVLMRTKDFDVTLAWIESFPAPDVLFKDAKTGRTQRIPKKVAKARINVVRGSLMLSEGQKRGNQAMIDAGAKLVSEAMADTREDGAAPESPEAGKPACPETRSVVLQKIAAGGRRLDRAMVRGFILPESKLTLTSIDPRTREALLETAAFHAHALASAFAEPRPNTTEIVVETAEALLCGFVMGRRLLGTECLCIRLPPSCMVQEMIRALDEYPISEAVEGAGEQVNGAIEGVARARSLRALWLRISDRQLAAFAQFQLLTKGLALALVEAEMSAV